MLNETSLFEVHGESENIRLLLVQEEGMSHKPSLLLKLSIADILRYWSLLTTDQRASFIETIAPDTAFKGPGGDLVTRIIRKHHELTIFDRFAGYFHAFGCLERAVKKALKEKTEKEATYRLFGKKYDSLGTLLERIDSDSEVEDSVDKYVIIMCAKQLCREVKNIDHGYWNSHGDDVAELNDRFKKLDNIRECLLRENPHDFRDFLDWFDNWFIQRAKPV